MAFLGKNTGNSSRLISTLTSCRSRVSPILPLSCFWLPSFSLFCCLNTTLTTKRSTTGELLTRDKNPAKATFFIYKLSPKPQHGRTKLSPKPQHRYPLNPNIATPQTPTWADFPAREEDIFTSTMSVFIQVRGKYGILGSSASCRGALQRQQCDIVLLLPALPYEGVQFLQEEVP